MSFDYKLEPGKTKEENYKYINKEEPIISVIMSYYNGKEFIEQTVNTVLNQTFPYFELLIIDDGSKDSESIEKLKEIEKLDNRIKVFRKENAGASVARDYGISKASKSSKYIFILDDDDLIDKTYFETAYFSLEANKDASWAYTDSVGFYKKEYLWNFKFNSKRLKKKNTLISCAMIRKDAILNVGGYGLKEKAMYEDWNLWLKLIKEGYYPIHMSYFGFWYRKKESGELKKAKSNNKKAMSIIKETAKSIKKEVKAIEFPREQYDWDMITTDIEGLIFPIREKNKKTNILLVIPWMVMGGADKFNLDFLKLINKEKYSVTVLTTQPTEYLWRQEFEQAADEVFDLSTFIDRKYWPLFINYIIKTRNIDIFFNTNSLFGYAAIPYIKATNPNLPIIDYIHMEEWYNRNGGYSRDSSIVNSIVDRTLFCNKNSERIFAEHFKMPSEKISTVYIGVDPKDFEISDYNKEKLLEKYNVDKNKINIGYICRIANQKRPFLLVEIMKETIKENNNIQFLIGGDGPLLNELKRKIKNAGIDKNVKLLGKITKPQEFYTMCDLTLNCSIKEGLALTTYESLAMGIPVISSDVGGQKEMITDDVGVIIPLMQKEEEIDNYNYKKEEIEAYKDAILKVLNDIDKYKKNARKRIIEGFTLDNMIKNMEKEIDNVINNPNEQAIENGKKLADNINITKEYINHFLMANKNDYSYLCGLYNEMYYSEIMQSTLLKRLVFKSEEIASRLHLINELMIVKNMVKAIKEFFVSILRLIKLQIRKIINIIKRVI